MEYTTASRAFCFIAALSFALPAWASEEILLGYLVAKSGPFVSIAETNAVGAQIAVDEINAAGGINGRPLRIVEFDTAGNPAQAVLGIRQLVEDEGVLAVIGPFSSSEVQVVFPQAERAGVVAMSMASSAPGLAEPFSYGFRNTTNEGILIARAVETLKKIEPAVGSASIAYATDDAVSVSVGEKVLPSVFNAAGLAVDSAVTFQYEAFDLSVQVSQLVAAASDIVGVGAPPEAAIKLANEMRRQGHEGRLVAGTTVFDVNLPERMGAAGEGTVLPTTFYWGLSDETRAFAEEFKTRADALGLARNVPAQFDAATYSIVKMYADAISKTGATGDAASLADERTAIRDHLAGLKDFTTVEGPITFGADGDAVKSIYVMEISGGDWKHIDTYAQ